MFTNKSTQLISALFTILAVWWCWIFLSGPHWEGENLVFGAVYGTVFTFVGAVLGYKYSKKWGGWSSTVGRSMIILSLGLVAQLFGQLVFSYYNIVRHVDVPYPSLADVGYFGSIPLYVYGMWLLAKASGVRLRLSNVSHNVQIVLVPLLLLVASYVLFLRTYEFDWAQPLLVFLDFGYPLGQAVYVSVALLTYSLSRSMLGGVLRENILLFIYAFLAQYVADFNFLYQNIHGTWENGGYGDFLYLLSYFIMTMALVKFGKAVDRIEEV